MTFRNIALATALVVGLSGCGVLNNANDAARPYSAPAAAETYAFRCNNLSVDQRMQDWAAIQAQLDKVYPGIEAPIFDCDRDGAPDFVVQDVIDAGYYSQPQ